MMILIVTERLDPHVDHVASVLDQHQIHWRRLHLSEFPSRLGISYRGDNAADGRLAFRDADILLDDIDAVWYRRTESPGLPPTIRGEDRRFARAECQSFLRGLWTATADCNWVSHPDALRNAGDKAEQLSRARRYGLHIPRTLFSNNAEDVRDFCDELGGAGNVVYKPHNSMMFSSKRGMEVVYTVTLDAELCARLGEVRYCPGIFQEKLTKQYDVRVTIFGDRVFAVAIHSQEDEETKTDWRAYTWGGRNFPEHEIVELQKETRDCCVALVHSYDLQFGAIDLVRTRDGRDVFLELNPNGQWAWMEAETGLPMAEALVALLSGGSR
jgi:glutathione synthase/RimK-type ligase-like ATP-grasp enzyme